MKIFWERKLEVIVYLGKTEEIYGLQGWGYLILYGKIFVLKEGLCYVKLSSD